MEIGRSAPRHERMALLYPRSQGLQAHFSEYFIEIVQLCRRIVSTTRKPFGGQLASALTGSGLDASASNLETWAKTINKEVLSLIAQSTENEVIENARFRAASNKAAELTVQRERLKRKLCILNACSKYDHESTWMQTRRVGNATIPNYKAEYRAWRNRDTSSTLICTGKLGSGKSVLLSNIVDDLNLHLQPQGENSVVTYFFCRRDIAESLKERTIVRSFARQVLRHMVDLSHVEDSLDETLVTASSHHISKLLSLAVPRSRRIFLVLDGLDECEDREKHRLMQTLCSIQHELKLMICVSLRLEVDNLLRLSSLPFLDRHTISIPEDNPDINDYINEKLQDCVQSCSLTLGDPRLIVDIYTALTSRAQGMFLWVALQIELLCLEKTDEALRAALECLPKDLSEIFTRVLKKSQDPKQRFQKRTLELLIAAQQLLTTAELREALSVVPGDTVRNPATQINNIHSILSYCGSLIIEDEQDRTVRLIHQSVRQFLLEEYKDTDGVALGTSAANKSMADIIVTYLNYDIFDTKLSTWVMPQIIGDHVTSAAVRSTLSFSSKAQELALKALKSVKYSRDVSKNLAELTQNYESRSLDDSIFLNYSRCHLLDHCWCYIWYLDSNIYDLLLKVIDLGALQANPGAELPCTPVSWESQEGHLLLLKLFLVGKPYSDALGIDGDGLNPLMWATRKGYANIVRQLLQRDPTLVNTPGREHCTVLSWAVRMGYTEIARFFVENCTSLINTPDDHGHSPLWYAVTNESKDMIDLLLAGGADLEIGDKKDSPLIWISENERLEQILDAPGTCLDPRQEGCQKELVFWALKHKNQELARKILMCFLGENMPKEQSALWCTETSHWAVRNGYAAIVKLLLQHGADPNAVNRGTSLLSLAFQMGHAQVVKQLLKGGADFNIADLNKALLFATEENHRQVVELLLERAANLNIADPKKISSFAAEENHTQVRKVPLEKGVSPNTTDVKPPVIPCRSLGEYIDS